MVKNKLGKPNDKYWLGERLATLISEKSGVPLYKEPPEAKKKNQ